MPPRNAKETKANPPLTPLVISPVGRGEHFGDIRGADTYYSRKGAMIRACNSSRKALRRRVRFDYLANVLNAPSAVTASVREGIEEALAEVDPSLKGMLEELLSSGRFDLSLILSSGKSFATTDTEVEYAKLATYVQRNGAVPRAIFGQEVIGSGAVVGMMMPRRIVLPDTTITLALPFDICDPEDMYNDILGDESHESLSELAQESRDDHLRWLRSKLLPNLPKGLGIRAKAEAWLEGIPAEIPADPSEKVNLHPHIITGQELVNAGAAEMVEAIDRRAFMELLGLKGDPYRVIPNRLASHLSNLAPQRAISGELL